MQHFVLTRFSYRGARVNTADDPLEPRRLRRRMRLFETITAPSIAGQSGQQFTWVVVVDPALPGEFRSRLHALTATHPNLRIVENQAQNPVERLGWLDRLSPQPAARWVLTTNLDDDDALASGFVVSAQREARDFTNDGRPLTLFGVESAQHWRFIPHRNQELGSVDGWRRSLPVSAGLSLLCDRSALDLSVLMVSHRDACRYGSTDLPADLPAFRRRRIERVHSIIRDEGATTDGSGFYRPFRSPEAAALMVSHLDNVQAGRIFTPERKARTDVEPILRHFGVDVAGARSIAPHLRLSWVRALSQVGRLYRADAWAYEHLTIAQRIRLAVSAGRRVFFGFTPPAHQVAIPKPARAQTRV